MFNTRSRILKLFSKNEKKGGYVESKAENRLEELRREERLEYSEKSFNFPLIVSDTPSFWKECAPSRASMGNFPELSRMNFKRNQMLAKLSEAQKSGNVQEAIYIQDSIIEIDYHIDEYLDTLQK